MGYVRRSAQRYVILTGSHTIYNCTYDAMLKSHIESGADVTIMYSEEKDWGDAVRYDDLRLTLGEGNRITDLEIDPYRPKTPYRCYRGRGEPCIYGLCAGRACEERFKA